MRSFPRRLSRLIVSCRAVFATILLIAPAWSGPAFCGPIHDAAGNGDLAKVKALLQENPDLVSSKDDSGHTPLHAAAASGYKDVVEFLLANKAGVNAKDNQGYVPLDNGGSTPLHYAADRGHKDVVELLLASKADVNAKDSQGDTPLKRAAYMGHKDVVEVLLANGADVDARNKFGMTPLDEAANGGYEDVAVLLLAKGADVNAADNDGHTALYWATLGGRKDVEELLRQHGGQQTSAGPTGMSKNAGYRTFLGGQISIKGDISGFETKSFTCKLVQPLKKGDTVAAMVSDDQAWSIDTLSLPVGANHDAYPVLAMVKSSDGFHSLFPAVLKAKTDINAGETLLSDGYRIEAKRAVKAGDSIAVLYIGDSLLSVEAAARGANESEANPWFAAFKDGMKPNERASAIEVWRIEKKHVSK